MNEYMNAQTAVIVDGIAAGERDAIKAAYVRRAVCKLRNAKLLDAALREAGLNPEKAPAWVHGAAKAATTKAAPKAAAPKAPRKARTKLQQKHTQLREQAYAWRLAEYHEGRKHTVAEAYAKFGTAHAAITNAPGFKGI